jgi:hypothetical protein
VSIDVFHITEKINKYNFKTKNTLLLVLSSTVCILTCFSCSLLSNPTAMRVIKADHAARKICSVSSALDIRSTRKTIIHFFKHPIHFISNTLWLPLEILCWGIIVREGGKRLKSAESRVPTCIINNNLTDLPFCKVPTAAFHTSKSIPAQTRFRLSSLIQHFGLRDKVIPGTL